MSTAVVSAPVGSSSVDTSAVARHQGQRALVLLVGLELVALYWPTVRWLVDRWTLSVWHHAHGLLIPPVVAYFVWKELRQAPALPRSSSSLGFVLLIPALGLHMIDAGLHTQILSAASIVLLLPALSLLFLGVDRTRLIAFPLTFMVFMLPIPLAVTEQLQIVLRHIATAATAQIVPWFGISVYAEPMALHLSNGVLVIADACSGFSTLYASCAVAALSAYSCNSTRRRLLTIAAAVPVALAANIVRVVLLVILISRMGFEVLHTWMHPASGMLTFALALPVIFWLGSPQPERRP